MLHFHQFAVPSTTANTAYKRSLGRCICPWVRRERSTSCICRTQLGGMPVASLPWWRGNIMMLSESWKITTISKIGTRITHGTLLMRNTCISTFSQMKQSPNPLSKFTKLMFIVLACFLPTVPANDPTTLNSTATIVSNNHDNPVMLIAKPARCCARCRRMSYLTNTLSMLSFGARLNCKKLTDRSCAVLGFQWRISSCKNRHQEESSPVMC